MVFTGNEMFTTPLSSQAICPRTIEIIDHGSGYVVSVGVMREAPGGIYPDGV